MCHEALIELAHRPVVDIMAEVTKRLQRVQRNIKSQSEA